MPDGLVPSVDDAKSRLVEMDGHEGRSVFLGSREDTEMITDGAVSADHYCAVVCSGDFELVRVFELWVGVT